MFDFWFFRPNVRGTLLLNTWLTLIDWWTSLCKCCLASKISTPRSFPSWRITWSLWDHETTLRPLSFAWTKITKKKWSTTTPQTWRPRSKVNTLKIVFDRTFKRFSNVEVGFVQSSIRWFGKIIGIVFDRTFGSVVRQNQQFNEVRTELPKDLGR